MPSRFDEAVERRLAAAIDRTFNTDLTVTPLVSDPGGDPFAVRGQYDPTPVDVFEGGELSHTTFEARVHVRPAELTALGKTMLDTGDRVAIDDGEALLVHNIDPPVDGWSIVVLRKT